MWRQPWQEQGINGFPTQDLGRVDSWAPAVLCPDECWILSDTGKFLWSTAWHPHGGAAADSCLSTCVKLSQDFQNQYENPVCSLSLDPNASNKKQQQSTKFFTWTGFCRISKRQNHAFIKVDVTSSLAIVTCLTEDEFCLYGSIPTSSQ